MMSSCATSSDGIEKYMDIGAVARSRSDSCSSPFLFFANESDWKKLPMSDKIEENGMERKAVQDIGTESIFEKPR